MSKTNRTTGADTAAFKPSGILALTPPAENGSREFTLLRSMPAAFTAFSFIDLLHHHGLLAPFLSPAQCAGLETSRQACTEALRKRSGLSADAEIWPLVQPLGLARERADEIARTRLPGYMFLFRLLSLNNDETFYSPVKVCTDPALTAAVIARTKGRYYRSDTAPDYRLDHFLKTSAVCGDPRLFDSAPVMSEEAAP